MLAKGAESLPAKVAHDYKALAKLYDAKNHKKGLKNAEKILEQHPDHPETNAMKALFELGLGEQAKAEATAKIALTKSKMKSMFCWHTYGTVLKQRRSFVEAARCFQMAINFEKDNMQLLRETATLQIQIRDHNSHVATRLSILKLKPNMIHNWVAFAVAHHLVHAHLTQKGDFQQFFKALASIENLRPSADLKPIELSHYFVYRAIANCDAERYDKMYEELTKNKTQILDEDIWNELMYKCCMELKKNEEAIHSIEWLIKKYPENVEYMHQYRDIGNIKPRELYKKIRTEFKSKIAHVYELCTIEDKEEFKRQFAMFIKPYFQKNLISLFAEIQIIYETTQFHSEIEQTFLEFESSLKSNNSYPDGTPSEFPTEYLWSLYLLAQHYSLDFLTLPQALSYIDRAIEHTNTVTEFYIVKAEIEYKMHNNVLALKTINEARKTDLADRYMNNICIKYLFRCLKPALAEDILKLFMRDEASLYELQNQWYIIEAGKSYIKQRNFPAGLRHFYFVEKQFQDIDANQLDFHTYCIRKWTLREYIQYINFNDNLYKDKKYVEAAGLAIENLFQYQHLLQVEALKPKEEKPKEEEVKKKKKKNKGKTTANEEEELTPVEQFRKKIDYFGKEYCQKIKADPIQEAYTYAKNVTSAKYENKKNKKENKLYAKAFSNSIRVFIHLNKPMMAIRAHKKLVKTDSDPFLILGSTIKLLTFLETALANQKTHELTKQFIKQYQAQLLGTSTSISDYFNTKVVSLPQTFNSPIRVKQIELFLAKQQTRQNLVSLYRAQLERIIQSQAKDQAALQLVFWLVHNLELYGEFDDKLKTQLNQKFGGQTGYFGNWVEEIDKLPVTTWGLFWLSDSDVKREELEVQEEVQEEKKEKKEKKEESKKQSTETTQPKK